MNDLRSTTVVVAGVGDPVESDGGISAAPPRVRPDRADKQTGARQMSRRQSIIDRARREAGELQDQIDATVIEHSDDESLDESDQPADLDERARERLVSTKLAERASRRDKEQSGPNSRPSRRREVDEKASKGEDGFPWTFHLDHDDEPEELHASTPLLSRAFRATTG